MRDYAQMVQQQNVVCAVVFSSGTEAAYTLSIRAL